MAAGSSVTVAGALSNRAKSIKSGDLAPNLLLQAQGGIGKLIELEVSNLQRSPAVFLKLKALLEPFGIRCYRTDYWGAYLRNLDAEEHHPGKRYTQQIERKHLTLRSRIKRLTCKTIRFSKSTQMHDIVIGLFVNRYEFGLPV